MSGLGNNTTGVIYVNAKEGKFYLSTDKAKTTPYDKLSGMFMGIEFKEETLQGAPIQKAYFSVSASSGLYKFNIPTSGASYGNLVSFLKSADLAKEIEIVTIPEEGAEGKINTAYLVKQGGVALKGYHRKGGGFELPRWNKVQVNGKDLMVNGRAVWDKEEFFAALNVSVNEINAVANANTAVAVTSAASAAPVATSSAAPQAEAQQAPVTQPQAAPPASTTTTQPGVGTVTKSTVALPPVQEDDDLPF